MIYDLILEKLPEIQNKSLKRGQFVYHEGDEPSSIYLVKSGLVGLFHVSEKGKESFLRVFSNKDLLGHRSYFAHESYHASAVALTKTELLVIPKSKCKELCENSPEILQELIKKISKDLRRAEIRLAGYSDKSANQRIIESMIYLKLKHPEQTWTRKEIAEFSGSTQESVARIMTELEGRSLLTKEGRDFIIADPESLIDIAKSEY